jgi:hypothetical protein
VTPLGRALAELVERRDRCRQAARWLEGERSAYMRGRAAGLDVAIEAMRTQLEAR